MNQRPETWAARIPAACEPALSRLKPSSARNSVSEPLNVRAMMDDAPIYTLNALTLTEKEGRTVLRTVVEYPSKEIREVIIATGMMDGWAESYDRLERYLRSRA